MPTKNEIDPDLGERLRQFIVVCKVKFQTVRGGGKALGSLCEIGAREFGLTTTQIRYCIGRARNFLDEIRAAERARSAREMKIGPRLKARWSYMDDCSQEKLQKAAA